VIEELLSTPEVVHLTLLLALVKFDRFEMALEKGTEAGVAVFIPVLAERSEKGLDRAAAKRIERWRRILLEAGQQSRRDTLPVIDPLVNLRAATAVTAAYRYLLDEQPGAPPLLAALPDHRAPGDSVAVLVGPEGGWTPAERELAVGAGWSPVSLGPLLLRTETAAVAAAAVVFNAWWAAARR
jgi:16S rRNA (uracil1498-N3)-methyltransferase